MDTMKRSIAFSVVLLLAAAGMSAQSARPRGFANPLLNDVVEMSRASLPDETIIAYVKARQARLDADVTAGDLIRLRQAGVSDSVVRYIAGASSVDVTTARRGSQATYDSRDDAGESDVYPVDGDYAYARPYWYGWGYGYPYWYGYSPFFSTTFVVRGGFHGRGHGGFHGGRGGHGGHGGGHGGGRGR